MGDNIHVNGITYPDVEAISMETSDGRNVQYYPDAVRYNEQTLTEAQKTQARENIGAADSETVGQLSEEIVDQNSRIEQAIENKKGNIAQLIIEELQGLPVFGVVDSNNNITVTSLLPNGIYTLKYEDEDGTIGEIGTITVTDGGAIKVVNLLESAVGATGEVLNGVGYKDGYYLSGNPTVNGNDSFMAADASFFTTGFIPYTHHQAENNVPIYVKGVTIDTTNGHTRMSAFPSYDHDLYVEPIKGGSTLTTNVTVTQLGEQYYKITPNTLHTFNSTYNSMDAFNYIRFSLPGSGSGVIITVNQPIS